MKAEDDAQGLISSTSDITAYRCHGLGGRSFVFVDTPGFNGTYTSQSAVFKQIAHWLEMTYRKSIVLTGVIYTRRITDEHYTGTELRSFRMFSYLCGHGAADRIRIVTTMWDEINNTLGEDMGAKENEERMISSMEWRTLIDAGALCERFENTYHSAWDIIRGLGVKKRSLLVQEELVDKKMKLKQTTAGRHLDRERPWLLGKVAGTVIFSICCRTDIISQQIPFCMVVWAIIMQRDGWSYASLVLVGELHKIEFSFRGNRNRKGCVFQVRNINMSERSIHCHGLR
ncbi:hypothetical protein ID866_6426 [Astraeus odoratus]|nr:hypothetical protein ID866_6426 [Astraeus odoratus]